MSRISLNKTQWSKIQPHLSGRAATGRPPADDKRTLEAILFVLTTGCRWRDLPSEYGSYVTAWRRHRRWTQDGTFARIWHMLLFELEFKGKLDLKKCALDGSFVRAKRGPTSRQNPWRFKQQAPCRRRWERATAGSGAVRRAVPRRYPCPCRCGKYPDRLPAPPSTRPGCG